MYISNLKAKGQLIATQPLLRKGLIITGTTGNFTEIPFDDTKEVQVGYYHILAADLDEAVAIAKENPEFAFGTKANIEVHPIKMKEATTGFEYPKVKDFGYTCGILRGWQKYYANRRSG